MTDVKDTIEVKDGRLIVNVAIDTKGTPSASGKSKVFFSTHGNIKVNDDFKIGINLYK